MYFRWIDDLKLRNLRFTWNAPEQAAWGSALRCVDIGDLEIAGFEGRQALPSDEPAIRLVGVGRAYLHGCRAPQQTGTFLSLEDGTGDLTLIGNELSRARRAYAIPENSSPTIFEAANRSPE